VSSAWLSKSHHNFQELTFSPKWKFNYIKSTVVKSTDFGTKSNFKNVTIAAFPPSILSAAERILKHLLLAIVFTDSTDMCVIGYNDQRFKNML